MFFDVLCLKSIIGFLLSERTSGVSPDIFSTVMWLLALIRGKGGREQMTLWALGFKGSPSDKPLKVIAHPSTTTEPALHLVTSDIFDIGRNEKPR